MRPHCFTIIITMIRAEKKTHAWLDQVWTKCSSLWDWSMVNNGKWHGKQFTSVLSFSGRAFWIKIRGFGKHFYLLPCNFLAVNTRVLKIGMVIHLTFTYAQEKLLIPWPDFYLQVKSKKRFCTLNGNSLKFLRVSICTVTQKDLGHIIFSLLKSAL